MTDTTKKQYKRWAIIALVLMVAAIGGRWWAHRVAASVLRPHFVGLLELNDMEGLLLVLRYYPEAGRTSYRFWQPSSDFWRPSGELSNKDEWAETPLHYAAWSGNLALTRALLEIDADANAEAEEGSGRRPLHNAAINNHIDVAKLLLKAGADVDARDLDNVTPLHQAVRNGHRGMVAFLLEANADVNAEAGGDTSLHEVNDEGIARLLLKAGANANAKDEYGRTPLHSAYLSDNLELVKLLVKAGADVNARDVDGSTPLDFYDRAHGPPDEERECEKFLRKHGAKTSEELKVKKDKP